MLSYLADKLRADAEIRVAEARQRFEAAVAERDSALVKHRQEAAQLSTQLQRVQTELQGERLAHADTRQALLAATADSAQLRQHNADLQQRLADHERHLQSLEDKHGQARNALEHFRHAAKEQREQEQRQHEHRVQQLQLDLRTLNQTLMVKQHELSTAQHEQGRLAGELAALRSQIEALQSQLGSERNAAQQRVVQLEAAIAVADERHRQSRSDAENARQELAKQEVALRQAEQGNAQLQAKLEARPASPDASRETMMSSIR